MAHCSHLQEDDLLEQRETQYQLGMGFINKHSMRIYNARDFQSCLIEVTMSRMTVLTRSAAFTQ